MIEITNRQKSPIQLVIRSLDAPNSFTTLNLPGVGKGKNKFLLEDERSTEYIERAVNDGFITLRHLTN